MSLHLHHLQKSLPVLATHASPVCVETKEELIKSLGKLGFLESGVLFHA